MNLLILQQRAHKAGAQYALLRTLRTQAFKEVPALVILGEEGWLADQLRLNGIDVQIHSFPSARSLGGKILRNRQFTTQIVDSLGSFRPDVVLGNDHGEGVLTNLLAKKLHAKSVLFLRTPSMSARDFSKYGCDKFDLTLVIGDELTQRVRSWHPNGNVHAAYDGIEDDEFHSPQPKKESFPTHWLIVGGAAPRKGWQDFAEAIRIAEQHPEFPALTCDFTSEHPTSPDNDMQLDLPRRAAFNFIDKVNNLSESAMQYGLCVHPSRAETFGLAAAEIIAAGIPLLASQTGVLPDIQANPAMTFPPHNPAAQAECFLNIFKHWQQTDPMTHESHDLLYQKFAMNKQATNLHGLISQL